MTTIEERAREYAEKEDLLQYTDEFKYCQKDYIAGAKEQKAIDIDNAKRAFNKACGWLSTYTWYSEVFDEFMKNMEE